MIYIYDDSLAFQPEYIEKYMTALSVKRQEKIRKYRFQKDKALSFIAEYLLRFGLMKEFAVESIPEIIEMERGKPLLKDSDIFFNISHCDKGILCSISTQDTGCDIQDYSKDILEIKESILSSKEKICVDEEGRSFEKKDGADFIRKQIKEITRIWTLKEAYGKYYGTGLAYEFKDEDFSFIDSNNGWQNYKELRVFSREFENYAVSVFSKETMPVCRVGKQQLMEFIHTLRC